MGGDIGHYLVNVERICQEQGFRKNTGTQRLITLLPGKASAVVASLSSKEADDFSLGKPSLLKKYKLSTEEIRRLYRKAKKTRKESFVEFGYGLNASLVKWLRGTKAHGYVERLVDLICLEQLYESLSDRVGTSFQGRSGVNTIRRAAEQRVRNSQ